MDRLQPRSASSTSPSRATFWRERLETVLTRTIPSQHVQLAAHGILESLDPARPAAAAALPAQRARLHRPGLLGLRRRQVDRGRLLRPVPPPRRRHRGEDRGDRRRPRTRPGARRLPQLLVSRARARQALDQPPRQPRALQPRPPARRRHRLLPRHRPPPPPRHPRALRRARPRDLRPRPRPEARLRRPPGDRAGADQALPPHRRPPPPRPRRLLHRRARPPAALLRRRGPRPRRGPEGLLGQELRIQPVAQARSASRTAWSATPSARCTCTPPWPTSPPSSATRA